MGIISYLWLLMLPGWQGIALAGAMRGVGPDVPLMGLFAVGAVLMRAAGCAFNDIVDRDFDARVARTAARPIPSGQVSVRGAWAFLIACALASLVILLSLNLLSLYLGVASLALVAAYPFEDVGPLLWCREVPICRQIIKALNLSISSEPVDGCPQ